MATESPYDGTCPRCGASSKPGELCSRTSEREGCDTKIPLPTREEMLAAELPVERVFYVDVPFGKGMVMTTKVIYRHATEEIANNYLKAEAEALKKR